MKQFYSTFLTLTLISVFALFNSLTINAQQLPDSGFEDWKGGSFEDKDRGGILQNTYWHISNVEQTAPIVGTLRFAFGEQTDGRTGKAMKVYDKEVGAAGITETGPGYVSLGTPWQYINGIDTKSATAGTDGGTAFTYRPDSVVVWIKRIGNNVDKENYNIVFYSWKGTSIGTSYKNKANSCAETGEHKDEESDIRQATDANSCDTKQNATQIAEGWFKEKKEYTDWTRISVPIKYLNQTEKPEKCNLILSAGNYPNFRASTGLYDGNTLIIDDVELIYNSTIDELRINDTKVRGFSAATTDFTKANEKASYEPAAEDFTFFRSGRQLEASEYKININGAKVDNDVPVIVTITSEDKKSSTEYRIKFTTKQSTNFRPESITYKLDGTEYELPNWSANAYNYKVSLPFGTTATPEIVVVPAEASQTVKITQPSSPNGKGSVLMTAQSGASQTYTIEFSVAQLTDNTLKNILVNGEALAGFSSTKNNYDVELPLGTNAAPKITWESNYAAGAQTITLTSNDLNGTSGKATITVKVPGNSTTRTYTLNYTVKASSYAYLADLKVGGVSLEAFAPTTRSYFYDLPMGTKTLPEVTWEKGQSGQTITADGSGIQNLSGDYKITVKAEDGTELSYFITFELLKSSNVDLKAIYVNGTKISNFKADVLEYDVEVPADRTAASVVTVDKGEEEQTVQISSITTPEGTINVKVSAADGKTRRTYTITTYQNKSSDNTLKEILVDGKLIDGFSATQTEYTYTYSGTKPTVTYTLNDATAKATDKERNGVVTITVTAQDGSKNYYYVTLAEEQVVLSDYAYLEAIYVDGVAVTGFVPTTLEYNVTLATWAKPQAVTYDAKDNVTVGKPAITWNTKTNIYKATVKVTAEDGKTTNSYTLTFVKGQELSSDATLSSLMYDGTSVKNFSATVTQYNVTLPVGTTKVPVVAATATHSAAKVEITQAASTSGTASVKVTAEDGKTTLLYSVTFAVSQPELSSDATLSGIYADNVLINGFSATQLNYTITIPFGGSAPVITATANHSAAKAEIKNTTSGVEITVTAENGSTQKYNVTFIQEGDTRSSDATLKDLKVGGTTISGFSATQLTYSYEIPFGGTVPQVSATANDAAAQGVAVTQATSTTGTATIVVTAENGTTMTYTVQFSEAADTRSSDATLKDLKVDGTTISGFAATQLTYNYVIPFGGSVPQVSATVNDAAAKSVVTQATSSTMKATVLVTAENGATQTYSVSFTMADDPRSSDATLKDLQIDGITIEGFAATQQTYSYVIPFGGSIPQVSATANDAAAKDVVVTQAVSKTGRATIVVTAENGTTMTYVVQFSEAEDTRSNDATLAELTINGDLIDGFAATKTYYTYQVPFGAQVPVVDAKTNHSAASFVANQAESVTGTATIIVTAENGSQKTYTVTFSEASDPRSTDASLKSISIDADGTWSQAFRSAIVEYTYTLPVGTTTVPQVSCEVNNSAAVATIQQAQSTDGDAVIAVQAEHPDYSRTYTIHFKVKQSSDATLSAIYVNDGMIEGFAPQTTNYRYTVEYGGTIPQVTFTLSDSEYAVASVTEADAVPGMTQIVVTAQDGTQKTYTIRFVEASDTRNTDATLSSITINADGKWNNKFMPGRTSYVYTLPAATTAVPELIYTLSDANATVEYTPAEEVTGKAIIVVTAENPDFVTTYTIQFAVAKNSDATLADLTVEGATIQGFAPSVKSYTYEVAFCTKAVPVVAATASDQVAKVNIIQASSLDSKTLIYVIAEDGTQNLYQVSFAVAADSRDGNTTLAGISVDGEPLAGFAADKRQYSVVLPAGTVELPVIEAQPLNDLQVVAVNYQGSELPTSAVLTVTAENGSHGQYMITFGVEKSKLSLLDMIYLNGVELPGFQPEKLQYTFDIGSDIEVPVITVDKQHSYQTIEITTPRNNDIAEIKVISEDRSQETTYKIKFEGNIVISKLNPQLTMLSVNGQPVNDFLSDIYEYEVYIPKNINSWEGLIDYNANSDTKNVNVQPKTPYVQDGECLLILTATDDSTENTYKIKLLPELSTDATLSRVFFNGNTYNDFMPLTKFDYDGFDFATPEITYEKNYEEQTVIYRELDNSTVVIDVYAEDTTKHSTYTFKFLEEVVNLSSDITLQSIQIGDEVKSFADMTDDDLTPYKANPFIYGSTEVLWTVDLPVGIDTVPDVKVIPTDPTTQVFVHQEFENDYAKLQIQLIPQDKSYADYYVVVLNFHKATENRLQTISYGGNDFNVFDMTPDGDGNVYIDAPELPVNSEYPIVGYTLGEEHQTVSELGNGSRQVVLSVRAQDEKVDPINYIINFTRGKFTDATLKEIWVGSEQKALAPVIDHTIGVGEPLPVVTWVRNDTTQRILQVNNGRKGVTLLVVAEDGTTNTYKINYTFAKNNDATLKALNVMHGSSFADIFNDDVRKKSDVEWNDTLPIGTAQVPAVMPIPTDSNAVVTVTYGLFGEPTTIHVVSEDGNQQKDYVINFEKQKSSDATLNDVVIEDNMSFIFNSLQFNYEKIPVAYGVSKRPAITWEKGDPSQKIEFTDAGLTGISKIKVTSEDGENSNTYTFTFRRGGDSQEDNILKKIYVNGAEATPVADKQYEIELPYGTSDCVITYDSAYQGQTILVTNMGLNATSILRVYSNVSGVASTTYTVEISVDKQPIASLSDIIIDGKPLEGFDPMVYDYVYSVEGEDIPTVEYTFDELNEDLTVTKDTSNTKQVTYTIKDAKSNEEYTYNVFFFYAQDQSKLNLDFEDWENANYYNPKTYDPSDIELKIGFLTIHPWRLLNADSHTTYCVKPAGWNCPADYISIWPGIDNEALVTYYAGEEVNQLTENVYHGSSAVQLFTQYQTPMATSTPGVISLSQQFYNLGCYGLGGLSLGSLGDALASVCGDDAVSTCDYGDGLTFRNTPDSVSFWYKGQDGVNNKAPGWSFFMQHVSENKKDTFTIDEHCNGKYTKNWTEYAKGITYPENYLPSKLDIIISSTDTTPETLFQGTSGASSDSRIRAMLYVDYMQFYYNSTIASGSVLNTTGDVVIDGTNITVNITDENFIGRPELRFVNTQPYYKHDIQWSDDTHTSGIVRSYGEDLSYTEYTLAATYSLPTNTSLLDILVNGISVGINSTIDIPVPYGTTRLPKIEAVTSNGKQIVKVTKVSNEELPGHERLESNQVVLTVYAHEGVANESDPHSTYTLSFIENQSDVNTLVEVNSNGSLIEEPFDAEKVEFTTNSAYEEPFPAITYTKASDGQQVVMAIDSINDLKRIVTLVVTPENNSDSKTYTITQTKNKPVNSNGLFAEINVGGGPVNPLAVLPEEMETNKSDYSTDPLALASFNRVFPTDTIEQIINVGSIKWDVRGANGTNSYLLNFVKSSVVTDDAYLGKLVVDKHDQANLDMQFDFQYSSNDSLTIIATEKMDGQTLTPSYSHADRTFGILVEAVDATTQTYTVKINALLSDQALLETLSADGYTLSPEFNSSEFNYTLTPKSGLMPMPRRDVRRAPKKDGLFGLLPAIKANAKGEVQAVKIDYGNKQILIDVVPENGNEEHINTYTINIANNEKAPGLDNLTVFGIQVPDFATDKYNYEMTLPNLGDENIGIAYPLVGYVSSNPAQTVTTNSDEWFAFNDPGVIIVTAEVGSKSVQYEIAYTYTPSDISDNAQLAKLLVNNVDIPNLNVNPNPSFTVTADENGLVDVVPVRAEANQTVNVNKLEDKIEVLVTAQDGVTTNLYTLNLSKTGSVSSNTDINIYINGQLNGGLAYLDKNDENANVVDVDDAADVAWIVTEKGQKVARSGDGDRIILSVTAPDGVTQDSYYINVNYKKNVSYVYNLKSIRLDGKDLTEYATMNPYQVTPALYVPNIYAYRIDLPIDRVDTLPTIDAVKAADYQDLAWEIWWRGNDEKNDTLARVSITTGIKDRSDLPQRRYLLHFIKFLDPDAAPADILIDNIPMVDFTNGKVAYDPEQHDYVITLDTNTAVVPTVTVALKQHQDTLSVTRVPNVTNNPYTYRTEFVVRAQAGNTDTYSITIKIPQDDRNTLTDLRVDGLTIKRETESYTANHDFSPTEMTYNVTYPVLKDTTLKPVITYTASSKNAIVTLTEPQTYSDTAVISVEPFYGEERIYKVYFTLIKDTVTTLSDLQLDGATIAGFDPDKQAYNVELQRGTLVVPEIEGFATSPRATVSVAAGNIVDRKAKATITVTSEAGTQRVYTIDFTVAVDNTVTLAGILIDNVEFEEFMSNVYSYSLERDTTNGKEQNVKGLTADNMQTLDYDIKPLNDGGKSVTITVTAESGDKGYYTLNFTMPVIVPEPIKLDSNAYLSPITIDNQPLEGFNKEVLIYDVKLSRGTEEIPNMEIEPESDKATMKIDTLPITDHKGEINILVTSEAKTTLLYTLRFTVAVDSTTTLNNLTVDGVTVPDFIPENMSYTVYYKEGSELNIEYEKADEAQTVDISSIVTEQATIVFVKVTAEAGPNVTRTYIVTLVQETEPIEDPNDPNKDATLSNITIDGVALVGFDSKTLYYKVELDAASWDVIGQPAQEGAIAITDRTQITQDVVQAVITVTALDGVTTLAYTVIIVPTPEILPDPTQCTDNMADILVGEESWANVGGSPAMFTPGNYNYSLQLPDGTTDFPEIKGVAPSESCLEITESGTLIDERTKDYTITVRGKDNNDLTFDKATYTIRLTLPVPTTPEPIVNPADCPAELEGLRINGQDWDTLTIDTISEPFQTTVLEYTIRMRQGTTVFPAVTGYLADPSNSCLTVINGTPAQVDEYNRTEYIIVRGKDNNGLMFDKATYTIKIVLPIETPEPIVNPADCPDELEGILVDGVDWNTLDTISDSFSAEITDYTIRLPQGITDFPMNIEGFASGACLEITESVALIDERNKDYIITVRGKDNNDLMFDKATYTIHVVLPQQEEPVVCDTLENIFVGETAWELLDSVSAPFRAAVKEYDVYLPAETEVFPEVSGYLTDPDNSWLYINSVEVTPVDDDNSDAVILIDDGCNLTTLEYIVHLHRLPFTDATIKDIDINGEPLEGFRSDSTYYVVNLPVGTRTYFETLEWYMSESKYATGDTIRIDNDTVFDYSAQYQIHTTAQSGDTMNYFIDFIVAKSDTADLSMIYFTDSTNNTLSYDDYTGQFFNPEVMQYSISLPRGTTELPVVTYDIKSQYAVADAEWQLTDSVNGTLYIHVVAEDGTEKTYSIIFGVEMSDKAYLDDITLELHLGDTIIFQQLNNFDPRSFNYFHTLPYGITTQQQVQIYYDAEPGIKTHEERGQTLADTTYVTVTAEDGVTTNTYTIVFAETRSSNANPLMIYLDAVAMDTTELVIDSAKIYMLDVVFDSLVYEYHVTLPAGMTTMPEVTVLEGDTQQVIVVTPVDSTMSTIVTVTAGAGRPTNEYTIFFTTSKFDFNTLNDLLIDGQSVEGFRPDSNDYVIYYPAHTPYDSLFTASDITWVLGHSTETVTVTQQDSLTYLVTVTAENGSANTYLLTIEIRLSDNALLDSLLVNGVMIPDFDPNVFEYEYYLYKGQQVSDVEGIPQDTAANATTLLGTAGEEYTLVNVIAEDDSTTVTYKIWFQYLEIDLASDAEYDEVCIRHMGGNLYKAASMKKNVQLCIYDLAGRLLQFVSVPVIDANENLCEGDTGVEIELEADNTYIYTFFNNQERRVSRGKIMHTRY